MKTVFNSKILMALCAVLSITLLQSIGISRATVSPEPLSVDVNLSGESNALNAFHNDLGSFREKVAELKKKPSLTRVEFDAVQRTSDSLKGRVSGVQNTIREIIRKLKAAGQWDNLDAQLLANTTDGKLRTFFQQSSFRQDLEDAAANLGSQANDISTPVDNLRQKLALRDFSSYDRSEFRVIPVAYKTPAPVAFTSLACTVGKIRIKLIQRLGGTMTNATADQVSCACNPGAGIGLGTGTSCSQLN